MDKDYYLVEGGSPLEGSINISGAKNSITKLLVASLLSDKRCTFYNVPNIQDVEVTLSLCKEIGMEAQWDKQEKTLSVITKHLKTCYVPQRFSGANRIPILLIGALLGRTRQDIIVPTLGGCKIGKRPVDFHIQALSQLGAKIELRNMQKEGAYFAQAHDGLLGNTITLPYPSIGATENSMLAAVRAQGTTTIKNAAIEPEIVDLVLFLQKLGANIAISNDRTITIQGTNKFHEVEHTVIPDRLQAASYAMAAICTKGQVFIEGIRQEDMVLFLNKIREVGGGFKVRNEGIEFFYQGNLTGGIHLETDVHPGFATDWQQPFVVLLTQSQGTSVVHETVYENRFGYTQALIEMGADIELFHECLGSTPCRFQSQRFHHSLIVKGPTPLQPKEISVPDLRAGFAYVMAALTAEGTSKISGLPYLDRGYEELEENLLKLNANIKRHSKQETPLPVI
jgi:UDP-N-acetylglucosamine 1-carboxyvinyltransferase